MSIFQFNSNQSKVSTVSTMMISTPQPPLTTSRLVSPGTSPTSMPIVNRNNNTPTITPVRVVAGSISSPNIPTITPIRIAIGSTPSPSIPKISVGPIVISPITSRQINVSSPGELSTPIRNNTEIKLGANTGSIVTPRGVAINFSTPIRDKIEMKINVNPIVTPPITSHQIGINLSTGLSTPGKVKTNVNPIIVSPATPVKISPFVELPISAKTRVEMKPNVSAISPIKISSVMPSSPTLIDEKNVVDSRDIVKTIPNIINKSIVSPIAGIGSMTVSPQNIPLLNPSKVVMKTEPILTYKSAPTNTVFSKPQSFTIQSPATNVSKIQPLVKPLLAVPTINKSPIKIQDSTAKSSGLIKPLIGTTSVNINPFINISPSVELDSKKKKDLRDYIDTFYTYRNGIDPFKLGLIKEFKNYTEETLTYMTPWKRADKIRDEMLEIVPQNLKPITIVEVCAGIGGNTMSFLSSTQIAKVISYEIKADRRQMLKATISAYGFKHSIVSESGFDVIRKPNSTLSVPDLPDNSIIYFDPPWLLENVKGENSTKDDYITAGIKIGSFTLEDWIIAYKSKVVLIIIQCPPNYNLDQSGFNDTFNTRFEDITSYYGKQSSRVFYISQRSSKVCIQGRPIGNTIRINDKTSINDTRALASTGIMTKPTNLQDIIRGSKTPVQPTKTVVRVAGQKVKGRRVKVDLSDYTKKLPSPNKGVEQGSDAWLVEFKQYISSLISTFIKEETREKFLTTEAMAIWMRAFTHSTWNPEITFNYETLETIGDEVLAYAFKVYLFDRFPTISNSAISEFRNHYLQKMYLKDLGSAFKMGEWVLSKSLNMDENVHVLEDLFESFLGALHMIGDKIRICLGAVYIRSFITDIFNHTDVDWTVTLGAPKTIFQQYFHGLHLSKPNEHRTHADRGGYNVELKIGRESIEYLSKLVHPNTKIPSIIATAHGSFEGATAAVYVNALKAFDELGLTAEVIKAEKNRLSLANLDRTLVESAQNLLKSSGYRTFTFSIPSSTAQRTSSIIQLIGISGGHGNEPTTRVIFGTITINRDIKSEDEGKTELLRAYVGGKVVPFDL